MKVFKQYSLKPHNTFGIDVSCDQFIIVSSEDELENALEKNTDKYLLLGGGSNILFTRHYNGCVIHLQLRGIKSEKLDDDHELVTVAAGENWHQFVLWCIQNNLGGVENLSLIPGNCGAAPIQNIGAYGVELKECFQYLKAYDTHSGSWVELDLNACQFAYRDSIFKSIEKERYIITEITLKLTSNNHHLNTSYGAISDVLKQKAINTPTIKDISNTVIEIRNSKLPDPEKLGNSGSFFKNPVVPMELYEQIPKDNVPNFPVSETETKVPAGWLIEQCGWKGKRFGDAGCHKDQALVLVNYGSATGEQVIELANEIRKSVYETFGILLVPEVNII